MFITFEGIDACGKSTQIQLLQVHLQERKHPIQSLRDPGATIISEKIRAILLDKDHDEMSPWTELLLYEAARAQMAQELVKPALAAGTIVLSDRFYDSTTAYQGYGRQLAIGNIHQANMLGSCGLIPDLTFFFDLPPEETLKRKAKLTAALDRLESAGLEFLNRVRNGYLAIAAKEPTRIVTIDGTASIDGIHQQVITELYKRYPSL